MSARMIQAAKILEQRSHLVPGKSVSNLILLWIGLTFSREA